MSNDIRSAYINALLADACYVEGLFNGMTPTALADKLGAKRFPHDLATYISENFTVESQYTDPGSSGFSVTVFKDKSGQTYVSMRGTEPTDWVRDFSTDADAYLASGLAKSQIIEMVNWYQRAKAQSGDQVVQLIGGTEPGANGQPVYGTTTMTMTANGALFGAGPVVVDGHSLGGHLTTVFTRLFNSAVASSYTYNGLGVGRLFPEYVLTAIQNTLGLGTTTWQSVDPKQSNIYAEYGINVATSDWWLSQRGTRIGVFNEEQTGLDNHGMYKLTDTLALGDLMSQLDPTLTITRLNNVLDLASNTPAASLESTLDSLRKLISGSGVTSTKIGDAEGNPTSRTDYQNNLQLLAQSNAFKALTGKVNIDLVSGSSLSGRAANDFSAVASLIALSSIVLTPIGRGNASLLDDTLWSQGSWASQYQLWQDDRTKIANGQAAQNFTSQWVTDRAAMLTAVVYRNQIDATGVLTPNPSQGIKAGHYLDIASNTDITVGLDMSTTHEFAFGGDAADTLFGRSAEDHLYGGAGDDTLNGMAGNDYLEGGSGTDTYLFTDQFGNDTILDAGGQGTIKIGTQTLTGGKKVTDTVWESDDKRYVYVRSGADLVISTRTGGTAIGDDIVDAGMGNDEPLNAIYSIAISDHITRARGLFDCKNGRIKANSRHIRWGLAHSNAKNVNARPVWLVGHKSLGMRMNGVRRSSGIQPNGAAGFGHDLCTNVPLAHTNQT